MYLLGPTRSRASQVGMVSMAFLDSKGTSVLPIEGMTMGLGVTIIRPARTMIGGKVGQWEYEPPFLVWDAWLATSDFVSASSDSVAYVQS